MAAIFSILSRWRRTVFVPAAWIAVGASLAIFILASALWWEANQNIRLSLVSPRSNDMAREVKDKLEAYEKRADDLEKLLSLLVALTAVYGIALGLTAYAQAKESADKLDHITEEAVRRGSESANALARIEEEAKREAGRLTAEVDKTRADARGALADVRNEADRTLGGIRDKADRKADELVLRIEGRFPVLSDLSAGIRRMLATVTRLFPEIDWSAVDYTRLHPQDKQQILYFEKSFAALEPFNLDAMRKEASEIYHGLGNFYGVKYRTEKKEYEEYKKNEDKKNVNRKDAAKPAPVEDDKERSRFYLDLSLRVDDTNVAAMNDRIFFALNVDPSDQEYAKAERLCEMSLKQDPEQQRARYNLALLEHTVKQNYGRSDSLLTDAVDKTRWQLDRPARHRFSILYNRACARSRLGELDKAMLDLEEAIPAIMPSDEALRKQFLEDIPLLKEALAGDLKAPEPANPLGGDLYHLSATDRYRQRVQNVAARLGGY